MIQIRLEEPQDIPGIQEVNGLAFGQANEAALVNALRDTQALTISLVAIDDNQVIGHIAFSPVVIQANGSASEALGLGPMAVLPSYQRKGIGTKLVEAGLCECAKTNYELVVLLGHPEYYPRFGFVPSKPYGIEWEVCVPDEAFMVRELKSGALSRIQGIVKYHPAFSSV